MQLNLRGKTAIVTGASKGIGRAIAHLFAEEGCDLHLAARTEADLAAVRDTIRSKHQVSVTIHPTDLSDSKNVRSLIAAAGDADILVNNAGAIPGGAIDAVDEDRWRKAWDLKVFGYINMCREIYPRMKARGDGVIINVIGTGGERPSANYIAGAAGNAGLMAFSRAMGAVSANDGIRIMAVNPGAIETERLISLAQNLAGGASPEEAMKKMTANLPFKRAGRPEEVADLVVFLASERASYISGTVITIDAGAAARA
ncbi:MAG: SDR family oxidoreductase [Alphaproteobacteria bacterium]|nr:SDR family oxidoreductase [Alphaproteobacteria bacterium]